MPGLKRARTAPVNGEKSIEIQAVAILDRARVTIAKKTRSASKTKLTENDDCILIEDSEVPGQPKEEIPSPTAKKPKRTSKADKSTKASKKTAIIPILRDDSDDGLELLLSDKEDPNDVSTVLVPPTLLRATPPLPSSLSPAPIRMNVDELLNSAIYSVPTLPLSSSSDSNFLSRQKTVLLTSSIEMNPSSSDSTSSASIPSKSTSSKTAPSTEEAGPELLAYSKPKKKSLFQVSSSIDIDAIRNSSNLHDLAKLKTSMRSSSGASASMDALESTISGLMDESQTISRLDDDNLDNLLQVDGPPPKRHCPTATASPTISKTPSADQIPSKKSLAVDPGIEALLNEIPSDYKPSKAYAPNVPSASSKFAQALKHEAQRLARTMDQTDAHLGAYEFTSKLLNRKSSYQLVFVLRGIRYPVTAQLSSAVGSILKDQHMHSIPLPILLENEEFIVKMDGLQLDLTQKIADLPLDDGTELEVAVKRDGKEIRDGLVDIEMNDTTILNHDPSKITLKVTLPGGKEFKWRIGKTDPFQKIIDASAKELKVTPSKIIVKFDGDSVRPDDTVQDHDMEDDDLIDIIVKK